MHVKLSQLHSGCAGTRSESIAFHGHRNHWLALHPHKVQRPVELDDSTLWRKQLRRGLASSSDLTGFDLDLSLTENDFPRKMSLHLDLKEEQL